MKLFLLSLILAVAPTCEQVDEAIRSGWNQLNDFSALVETVQLMGGQLKAQVELLEGRVEKAPEWADSFEEGWQKLLYLRDQAGGLSQRICILVGEGGSVDALLAEIEDVAPQGRAVGKKLEELIYQVDSAWALRAALESEIAEFNLLVDQARAQQSKLDLRVQRIVAEQSIESECVDAREESFSAFTKSFRGQGEELGRLVKEGRGVKERLDHLSSFDKLHDEVDKRREEVLLMQEQIGRYIEQARGCLS